MYIYIYIFFIVTKGSKRLQVREIKRRRTRTAITDIALGINIQGITSASQPAAAWIPLRQTCSLADYSGSDRISNLQRISRHYIIFLTPTPFSSNSQFTWFIYVVPLFTQVRILFRNPQLTCCQRTICNILTPGNSAFGFWFRWYCF